MSLVTPGRSAAPGSSSAHCSCQTSSASLPARSSSGSSTFAPPAVIEAIWTSPPILAMTGAALMLSRRTLSTTSDSCSAPRSSIAT
jgi:hypothetical protein